MSLSGFELELAVLDTIVPQLQADGFRVVIRPKKDTLPLFLQNNPPDMVAYKDRNNLAIEIISDGSIAKDKERRLARMFADHPDWELRFVYAPPAGADADIPVVSRATISEHLDRLEASMRAMGPTAALLAGWAIFEAAARATLPFNLARPQPSRRLIETLASEGYVTPDEADMLRKLGRTRNEVAHGRLDLTPSPDDVALLVGVTRSILASATQTAA